MRRAALLARAVDTAVCEMQLKHNSKQRQKQLLLLGYRLRKRTRKAIGQSQSVRRQFNSDLHGLEVGQNSLLVSWASGSGGSTYPDSHGAWLHDRVKARGQAAQQVAVSSVGQIK